MSIYLELFHGRKNANEKMEGWGERGPILGPLRHVHTTYGREVKLGLASGIDVIRLQVIDDCLHYDQVLYGDWNVIGDYTTYSLPEMKARIEEPKHEKAVYVDPADNPDTWTFEVKFDELGFDAGDPRGDPLGTIYYKPGSRYVLGDEALDPSEVMEMVRNEDEYISFPVYAYVHSDVALSLSPFSCPWDSGLSGYIICTWEKARKYLGEDISREDVRNVFAGEIHAFEHMMNGESYLFRVKDGNSAIIDSVSGFLHSEDAEYEAKDFIRYAKEQYKNERNA